MMHYFKRLIFLLLLCITSPSFAVNTPIYIPLHGEVNPGMASFLNRALSSDTAQNADTIIIGIDTYGGRVDSAISISNSLSKTDVPVYALVEDKAWSAGALLALSTDAIYMLSGASIGSAAPVDGESGKPLGEKYVSALRTKFRGVAEANGYNPDLAEAMVDKDSALLRVRDGGNTRIIKADSQNVASSDVLERVISSGKLLNLTAADAARLGLVRDVVTSESELFNRLEISEDMLTRIMPGALERFISVVTSSTISSILLTLGMLFIFSELKVPGGGVLGLIGFTCLGLALGGQYLIDYAHVMEIGLFALGLLLIVLEVFVLPGAGILGILGLCVMVGALFMAFLPFTTPVLPWELPVFAKSGVIVFGSTLVAVLLGLCLIDNLSRIPGLSAIVLDDKSDIPTPEPTTRPSVGARGISTSPLRPVGYTRFDDTIYQSVSQSGYINADTSVEVVGHNGNDIIVKKVNLEESK